MAWKIKDMLQNIGIGSAPTLGIAFGGGGARGFAHIGALRAFEEFGMKPDVLAGVSAGSIAAVLYASGLTPYEMLECFEQHTRLGAFTEWTIPKISLMKMTRFEKLLDSWLSRKHLEELDIRTSICATDLDHGKSVGWVRGEIVPRVVASCSIPIIFPPVKINGINYVDGGVLRNLPAWAIRRHCTSLYGVICSPLSRDYTYKESILDVAMRSYKLMSKSNTIQDIALCDNVVQLKTLTQYKTFDIMLMREIMNAGYEATCRVLEQGLKGSSRKKKKN